MTIPVQTPVNSATANGVTTTFPFSFKTLSATDLEVSVAGVVVSTGSYSVTGIGDDAGGSVVFSTAPANGAVVIISLNPQLSRVTDYQQFGDWNAEDANNDFDRIWLALQALALNYVRALKLPVGTTTDQTIAGEAADRADKYLAFDSSGNMTLASEVTPGALAVSAFIETLLDDMDAASALATLGAQPADADIPTVAASQAEMEAGTETALRSMSPLRVAQAIAALSSGGMSASDILTALLTVDGHGSGLNADLLDGQEASAFVSTGSVSSASYWDYGSDEVVSATITSTTYTKLLSRRVKVSGTVNVRFALTGDADAAYGKIYKNGTAAGTERTLSYPSGSYTYYNENISVTAGDVIQIYGKAIGGVGTVTAKGIGLSATGNGLNLGYTTLNGAKFGLSLE